MYSARAELFSLTSAVLVRLFVSRATPEGALSEARARAHKHTHVRTCIHTHTHTHTADRAAVIRISINHEEWPGHMPHGLTICTFGYI